MGIDKGEFNELYRLEHTQHFTPERTALEVDALVNVLNLTLHERILDLGCGWGRHLAELRRRGFTDLVGVDARGAFLEPVGLEPCGGVTLLERDAAALGFEAEFDAVYCAFSALFAAAETASQVFAAVARALKPGGRLLFDTTNRERLAGVANPSRSWRGGGDLPWLLEETRFDLLTGAQKIVQRRIFVDGHTRTQTLVRYHYTLSELSRLLSAAGLTVTGVYGDWQLGPYTASSPRTLLTSRKEA